MVRKRIALVGAGVTQARAATLSDVAKAAGVHPSTVSRALNPQTAHIVNQETLERVRRVAQDLDYRINNLASNLRRSRSGLIGVVMRDFTNMMLPVMFRGIENRLRESGYMALLGNTYADAARKHDLVRTFLDHRVDGFVVTYADRDDHDLDLVRSRNIPLVLLNRETDHLGDPTILPDLVIGTEAVIAHLLELGHRRIGILAGPRNAVTADHKLDGFRSALARREIILCDSETRRAHLATDTDGEDAAFDLLSARPELTALACGNDLLALGAVRAAARLGMRCPEDLSITGFNDIPFLDRVTPPLTSVSIPHYEMGYAAAHAIVSRISGGPISDKERRFPCTLVVRASTSSPRHGSR
ncbi:LacI family DNA-binding transcriptional regulator [Aureimonas frigidaquae]|uniref:Transcriptional regulator, LacI family n=1 Tax=Aureimonas frigidaquae TaxID=424757 RepID=A0A0P0Z0E5_9HYPH|nr:LacI family DNA-binding transcriptional regulator [Aureimonas frigidaquae]BAT27410.1 transcriptional regulator, LacI family [Aureimonas frigidaquae]